MKFKNFNSGFTLIELMVVAGILAILLSIVVIAVNPGQQIARAKDLARQAAVYDLVNANNIYLAENRVYPWDKNVDCLSELEAGGVFSTMGECIREMTGRTTEELTSEELNKFSDIHVNKCKDAAVMCYLPSSKEIINASSAVYDKYGVNNPGCPGNGENGDCYWCKPIKIGDSCTGGGNGHVASESGKWGQAISMDGYPPARDPNYPDSKIPNEEVVHRDFNTGMEINSPFLTVEAWIKPSPPIPLFTQNKIVQSIFQLTLDAAWDGDDILYEYFFDVRQVENGCGRTVVYSGGRLIPSRPYRSTRVSPTEYSTWKHVAGVIENNELRIYENGKHKSTYTTTNNFTVCNDHQKELNIGAYYHILYTQYFQGLIDELRVSTVPRYDGDYSIPAEPFTPDDATMYLFHFDGDTKDSSGNGFDAEIIEGVEFVESDIPDFGENSSPIPTFVYNSPTPTLTNEPTPTPIDTPTPTSTPNVTVTPSQPPQAYQLDDSPKFYETYAVLAYDYPGFSPNWVVDISFRPDFGGVIHTKGFGYYSYGEPVTADADTIIHVAYAADGNFGSPTSPSYAAQKILSSKHHAFISMPYYWKQYREGCGKTVYWRISGWPDYEDSGLASPTYTSTIDCNTKVGAFNATGEDPYNWYIYYPYINSDGSVREGQPYNSTFDPNNDGKIDWEDYIILSLTTQMRSGGWEPPE